VIPLDITDETVLRRTLEEMENSIPILDASSLTITALPIAADLADTQLKIDQIIGRLDQIIKALDNR